MKGRYLKKLLSIILSIAIVSQIITIGTIAQEAPASKYHINGTTGI